MKLPRLPRMPKLKLPSFERLARIGLLGERRAIALVCLGFHATLFFLIALSAKDQMPEWFPAFVAMALVYGTAFVSVAAEWFWGRWFATGLGYSGVSMTVMALITQRALPTQLIVFGAMHGLIVVALWGERMAAIYDAKPEWRARFGISEDGVVRIRKSVTRAASSLPAMIMFALAPRQSGHALFALALAGVTGLGLFGLVRGRSWGLAAFATSLIGTALALENVGISTMNVTALDYSSLFVLNEYGLLAMGALALALMPFARPTVRYLSR